jgi:hypothetical protein
VLRSSAQCPCDTFTSKLAIGMNHNCRRHACDAEDSEQGAGRPRHEGHMINVLGKAEREDRRCPKGPTFTYNSSGLDSSEPTRTRRDAGLRDSSCSTLLLGPPTAQKRPRIRSVTTPSKPLSTHLFRRPLPARAFARSPIPAATGRYTAALVAARRACEPPLQHQKAISGIENLLSAVVKGGAGLPAVTADAPARGRYPSVSAGP